MRENEGGWSTEDERVSVRLSTDGACARDDAGFDITWHLAAPPGGSAVGNWALQAVDTGAVVTAPRTRDVAAAVGRIAVPEGREFDVGRLLRRAFDDLDGLELAMPGLPDAAFLGAGAPWFLTLFGRDSIVAASLLLPVAPTDRVRNARCARPPPGVHRRRGQLPRNPARSSTSCGVT